MITYLRLQNFRRHEDTELRFRAEDQLVLIAGRNGVGKSTLIEAITFALYGEGRNGVKNLDRLVRRGAELEGMEVEVEFVVAGTTYRVRRRRDSKASSAVLYGNDIALVERPREVTAEVSRILGMDARGFRLAVIAQQKELDGLAAMQAADRAKMLSRLLRLDAITAAKDDARGRFRVAREVVRSLGSVEDIDTLRAEEAAAQEAVEAAGAALQAANEAICAIDAELAASSALESAYRAVVTARAAADATRAAARDEVLRLEAELAGLHVPAEVPPPAVPLEELHRRAAEVERDLARAEAAAQAAAQHQMITREHQRVLARIAEIDAELAGGGPELCAAHLARLDADMRAAAADVTRLNETRQDLRDRLAMLRERARAVRDRLESTRTLGASCERCGQAISDDHKHRQAAELEAELAAVNDSVTAVTAEGEAVAAALDAADAQLAALAAARRDLEAASVRLEACAVERAELVRRRDTYAAQLCRQVPVPVDVDELYARKAELAIAISLAQQAEEASRAREVVLARKSGIDAALAEARKREAAAVAAFEAAAVDADLEAAYARRQEQLDARQVEAALAASLAADLAVAKERRETARKATQRAQAAAAERRRHEHRARVAAMAAQLLEDVEAHLATRIRPALEGSIAERLSVLSEGRFDAVSVDDDYNITVADDGRFRPISEFSGGEADLIALAVRLALAGVVCERHGAGGAGFLILDECFGSQDRGRQEAILSALRNLRSVYGQILLISHVGGLEDAADTVIDVTLDPESKTSTAQTV